MGRVYTPFGVSLPAPSGGGGGGPDAPASDWLFNADGNDSKGASNFTINGTYSFDGGAYLNIDGSDQNNNFQDGGDVYHGLEDFTFYLWWALNGSIVINRGLLGQGQVSGGTSTNRPMWRAYWTSATNLRVLVYDGTTSPASLPYVDLTWTPATGATPDLYVFRYDKSATTLTVRASSGGAFTEASNSSAATMQTKSSGDGVLGISERPGNSGAKAQNGDYHRLLLYTEVKDSAHDDLVLAHGAEGAAL